MCDPLRAYAFSTTGRLATHPNTKAQGAVVLRSLSLFFVPNLVAPFCRLRPLCESALQRSSTILSASGAMCGIGGTALLASHPHQTAAVFTLYLGSAGAWMAVGYLTKQRWLLASNVIYFMLALKGLT